MGIHGFFSRVQPILAHMRPIYLRVLLIIWAWPGLSRIEPYSSHITTLLRYWDAWKGPSKFELHMPFVDWSTELSHSTHKVFLDNAESLVYWRKCHAKVLSFLDVLHCCLLCSLWAFFFFLYFLAGYTVSGVFSSQLQQVRDHNACVAAVAKLGPVSRKHH